MSRTHLVTGIAVVASLAVVALFFVFANPLSLQVQPVSAIAPVSQGSLVVQDEQGGTGATIQSGDTIEINYTGKLQDGTVFDSNSGKAPISFVFGAGKVIPGLDQGLQGMKVGGKRLLIIPPNLGYGAQQMGPIPPNSTLIFEIELVKIDPPGTQ